MKTISRYFQTLAILAAGLFTAQLAVAQSALWSGAGADQNWSTSGNWSPGTVPGAATSVLFSNNSSAAATSPGTVDDIVDSSFGGTIASLQYANTNTSGGSGFYHTTQIGAGQTLTNLGNLEVGFFATNDFGGANQIYASIAGQGTLMMTNPSAFLGVSQGSATSSTQGATLNMTNLNTFNATIGAIYVGIFNTPNVSTVVARQRGALYLAKTNVINLIGSAPKGYGNEAQIEIGEEVGNGPNSSLPMYLGMMNTINVNTITVGGDKQGSGTLMAFNPVFTNANPLAIFRGTTGSSSRVTTWKLGDNSGQTATGSGCSGTVNFGNGTLDALVNTMILGEGESGGAVKTGTGSGTFTFTAGTNNVNTLILGDRVATGIAASGTDTPTGTMNVNGTATLIVNNAICMSFYVPNSGGSYGNATLNINGGTVWANTITNGVFGAANSTANINVNGGTLGITSLLGSIGASGAPLIQLNLSNAVVQLPVSGIQTNAVVSVLGYNGTANTINISSIPANDITYPKQISLIAYGSTNGTFNIVLGTLPGSYQGYISNNIANSSVDLVLTNGPTTISQLSWNGAANGNWDFASLDWSNASSSVAYFDGADVLFNDSAKGPTDIAIASTVSPESMMFNNNTLPYAFSGAGVGGAGSLTMNGTGSVLLTNSGNAFIGGVNVNSGTVQFGNGGTSGNLPTTGSVLDNGNLILDHSGNVSVPNTISGAGTLTESGTSVLTLTASNSFSGNTVINGGTLVLSGVLSGSLSNVVGSTIGGSGTNAGPINASGLVQPSASTGTPSTFTSGQLSLSSGATLAFDLNGNNATVGGGINDLLSVNGNLNVNNNTISANFIGVPVPGTTYTVIQYTGIQNGTLNSTIKGTHFGSVVTQSGNRVTVALSGSGANLKWDSTISSANNLWNVGTSSNWTNLGTSAQDVFYQGDTVIFDDSVVGVTNLISIPAGISVSPTVLSNNSSAVNYTIAGPGQIAGAVTIIKQGSSTLTMSSANANFTGTNYIEGGTEVVNGGDVFGAGMVDVTNGGTLELNNQGIGNTPVIISGAGVNGNGAIINSVVSANGDQHALDTIELSGDATIGGAGRWDDRANGAQGAVLTTSDGNTHNLVKAGANLIALVTCTIDSSIGNIDIQGGTLGFQLAATATTSSGWFGSLTPGSKTISVENGATLEFNTLGSAYPLYQNVALNNGSTLLSDAGDNAVSGNVTLQGNATISVTGGTTPWLQIMGTIGGSGNLIVNGTLPLVLSGNNTYTGNTLVNAGVLEIGYGSVEGEINNSSNIIVAAGAVLDVSQGSDQTLTLTNGQTLQGNGTVYGNVTAGLGSTISAGVNSTTVGVLSVTNNVTLEGNALMKLNPSGGTNDVIVSTNGAIVEGGTLTLTNVSGVSFTAGESFQLFNATNFSGAFNSIVPATPGAGLAWNTNNLSTTGTLSVVAGAVPPTPHITSIALSGTQLVINGTNGVASEQYNILTTTNVTLPISSWTVLPVGTFSGNAFSITNTVTVKPVSFYMIRVP